MILFSFEQVFGQNWFLDKSPTLQNLARLDMLNDSIGYAISYDGLILGYEEGKWTIIDSLYINEQKILPQIDTLKYSKKQYGDIYTIRVIDQNNAWIAVNQPDKKLYSLLHFNPEKMEITLTTIPIKIRAFDFLDAERGIAVGEGGAYTYTEGSWQSLRLPMSVDFRGVKYISEDKYVIFGDRGVIIERKGDSWIVLDNNVNTVIRDVDFINKHEGWFVGYNGTVLHYKDGTLEQEIAETIENLWSIDMLSQDEGFIVGEKGSVLQYNGEFWDTVSIPDVEDVDFHDLEMVHDSLGFAVGGRGIIIKYSNQKNNKAVMPPKFLFIDQVHIGSEYLMDRIEDVHGISVADFNSDKNPDIYLTCRKGINHLLINQKNGLFQDFVIESGTGGSIETRIGKQKYEYGSIAADFDRDGDSDLLLNGKRKTTRYFLNEGNAVFRKFAEFNEKIPDLEAIDGAVSDLDGDGYPDLIFADDNKGLRILRNMKFNRFVEEDLSYLDLPETGIRAVKSADLNGDMRSDIIAAYYHMNPYILWNMGDGGFECETLFNPNAENFPEYINSISLADINYDGYNDIYLCTENAQDVLLFYDGESGHFRDVSKEYGLIREGRSYSAVPGDYDLSGTLDLYVSRYGNDILYLNTGREFVNRSEDLLYSKAGYLSGLNTGAACLDIDSDGSSDVIVGNSEYWSSLLENQLQSRNFLKLTLEGLTDSRECLGAKIYIWPAEEEHLPGNLLAFREVILSYGYFSQIDADIIFGISDTVDISIQYLSGDIKDLDSVVPGSHLTVTQGSSLSRLFMSVTRKLSLWLHIPIVLIELMKFLIFLILIFLEMRFIEIRYHWSSFYIIIYFVSILVLYLLIGIYLENTGLIHHFIPFLILFLAMVILVGVNEPMRKISILSQNRQDRIYGAGMKLATTFTIEEAVDIIKNTLDAVFPYDQFSIFLYQQTSHLFLKLTDSGPAALRVGKFKLDREAVQMLSRHYEPLSHKKNREFWPKETPSDRDELLFPLIRKNTLIGLIFIHFADYENEDPVMETATIIYLFQQLAIALDNIQIMNSLREQEKIAAIGTFSSGIIHDLKNPVDGLRMIIESLAKEADTADPKREYIEELGEGIIQLKKRLLKSLDLINYRQDTRSKVNVGDLIKTLIEDKALLEFSEFDISIADDEVFVYANREQMGYALENIIYNAVEAGNLKDPVSIGLIKYDQELMLRVTDRGKGISDSEIDKIFNIFYTTKGDNRGLGLAITSNIIKNHGGRIDVSSEVGVGTTFTVTMPIYREEGE